MYRTYFSIYFLIISDRINLVFAQQCSGSPGGETESSTVSLKGWLRMKRVKITQEIRQSIRVWSRDSGLTQTEIGDIIGVSNPTSIRGSMEKFFPSARNTGKSYFRISGICWGKKLRPLSNHHPRIPMRHPLRLFPGPPVRARRWPVTGPVFYGRSFRPRNCPRMKKSSFSRSSPTEKSDGA